MKKQLLVIASMLFSLGANSQATWVSQATGFTDVSSGVRNVSAADANNVWIASYDGSGGNANRTDFSRTTDGGATWTAGTVPAPTGYNWSMIYGLDAMHAWAMFYDAVVGTGGGIWHTSDGGATWAQQGVGTIFNANSFPDVVHFWNTNEGFAMGDPNPATEFEIYTTTDGGTTWVPVPGANIPAPLAGEYGIVAHYNVIGNTIWFDTNKGRVYKSIDKGLNWTVSSTGITVPANGAIDICFYDANNGFARLYNQTTGVNTSIKRTTDGGATWTTGTAAGNMFGSDLKYIPGTTSKLISTGAATGFIGSSFSYDGGLTWVDIETSAQRTAIGAVDSNNIWCGGFTTSPTSDGIFKYELIVPVACNAVGLTAGTATQSDTLLCFGDVLTVTSTGVFAPTVGAYAGVSWVITSADITGSNDPLNEPSIVAAYNFSFPAPTTSVRQFPNDGTLIDGTAIPYGVYYFTPVIFGNATAAINPPQFLNQLLLDVTCTYSGNSVMCNILAPNDPLCPVGVAEHNSQAGSINVYPVPVSDLVNFSLTTKDASANTEIMIKDAVGRVIYSDSKAITAGENKFSVSMKNQSAGIYFITVTNGSNISVQKFVKE